MTGADRQQATAMSEQLRVALDDYPFTFGDQKVQLKTRFGVAELDVQIATAASFMAEADKALTAAITLAKPAAKPTGKESAVNPTAPQRLIRAAG